MVYNVYSNVCDTWFFEGSFNEFSKARAFARAVTNGVIRCFEQGSCVCSYHFFKRINDFIVVK